MPQMNSVHGSLSFHFFRKPDLYHLAVQIWIEIVGLKVPTSHPLTKGHSGAQLVQSSTHFVPIEKLRATRRVENYILMSAVFGKPPEKGYFIFYIPSVRVIERKEAHSSSSTQCGPRTDDCDPHIAWLPCKVPRPQMNSVHDSLSFRVATILISINSPCRFGFK